MGPQIHVGIAHQHGLHSAYIVLRDSAFGGLMLPSVVPIFYQFPGIAH